LNGWRLQGEHLRIVRKKLYPLLWQISFGCIVKKPQAG
jgi:hypothetical protein